MNILKINILKIKNDITRSQRRKVRENFLMAISSGSLEIYNGYIFVHYMNTLDTYFNYMLCREHSFCLLSITLKSTIVISNTAFVFLFIISIS